VPTPTDVVPTRQIVPVKNPATATLWNELGIDHFYACDDHQQCPARYLLAVCVAPDFSAVVKMIQV
jgi:hypothetical protein